MPTENQTSRSHKSLRNLLAASTAMLLAATAAHAQTAASTQPAPATSMSTTSAAADPDPSTNAALQPGDAATAPATPATSTANAEPEIEPDTFGRLNLRTSPDNTRTSSIDNLRRRIDDPQAPGVRVGTFIIRPTIGQGIGVERTNYGGSATTRSFLQTTGKVDIISDWALHELRISAAGVWQKNIGGSGATQPTANVDAKLRLDVDRLTIANLTAGYSFARESNTDPNSIVGASVQSGIHTFTGGADITREFGRIRGTVGGTLTRTVYSAATLSDGTSLSMSDRNQTAAEMKMRLGYEISPALIPFVEASIGRIYRDQTIDSSGYNRNARTYAGKAGVELDFGEKLRGEVSAGYRQVRYFDARLASIGAPTLDGKVFWSPIRGTDVNFGLTTDIDPSTTAGVSGSAYYTLSAGLSQQMIDNLVARVAGSSTYRVFKPSGVASDQTEWVASAGLTWSFSRYLELAGDVGWNYTDVKTGTDTTTWKAIVELRAKR